MTSGWPAKWVESEDDVVVDDSGPLNDWTQIIVGDPAIVSGLIQNKSDDTSLFVTNDASNADGFEVLPKGAWEINGTTCSWYGKTLTGTVPVHYGIGTSN